MADDAQRAAGDGAAVDGAARAGAGLAGGALGARLRAARSIQGIGLRELARRLEVSPSLVSQIETGKIHPSVRTLYAIVSQLGISLDDMFVSPGDGDGVDPVVALPEPAPQRSDGPVQRGNGRRSIQLESGVRWERLTTWNDRDADFLYATYAPGGESSAGDALVRHNGREFGIVLKGRLRVTVGFDEYELGPGDSIAFDSTSPHRLHNPGDDVVEAVWFVLRRDVRGEREERVL